MHAPDTNRFGYLFALQMLPDKCQAASVCLHRALAFFSQKRFQMKRQVTLRFPTMHSLKTFQEKISLSFFELSPTQKLLHCACTEDQIMLAKTGFNAVIVEKNELRPYGNS